MPFSRIKDDIASIIKRDPAAGSALMVILAYPGFHATQLHRLNNWLWRKGLRVLARWLSHFGRWLTGIEIHPGAKLGRRVFIDHGMGVVIGETADVGDDCTLYQGVTLGGVSLERGAKRHATLEHGVIVGAGAQVLGAFTVGANARIGANAVVVEAVKAGDTVVGIPARPVGATDAKGLSEHFLAYGTPCNKLEHPAEKALCALTTEIEGLRARLVMLEKRLQHHEQDKRSDGSPSAEERPEKHEETYP